MRCVALVDVDACTAAVAVRFIGREGGTGKEAGSRNTVHETIFSGEHEAEARRGELDKLMS